MKIIGVTGSSGSGKSTVANILKEEYNAYLIDADLVAREIIENDKNCLNEIIENFGEDITYENKLLKRKMLAQIIYSDSKKRELLNSITFKYIKKEINKKIQDAKEKYKMIIIDAPLLFEIGLDKYCDKIIGVIADEKIKIERIKIRDLITKEDVKKRLNAQYSDEFFVQHCDYIVKNNFESEEDLKNKIRNLLQ